MKNLRMQSAALALMMAAAMMMSAGQAEAKKKAAAAATPPEKLSTDAYGTPIRYPEDPGVGARWRMTIERDTLWGTVRHLYWV